MKPILEVNNLLKQFGGLVAVSNVSFQVQPRQIKAVIGPNGAGKTTMFNVITGVDPPTSGQVTFRGTRTEQLRAHQVAKLGISRTFQNVELYSNLSVIENVMVGRHPRTFAGMLSTAFRTPRARREERIIQEDALDWLEFVGLADQAEQGALSLPLGQQRLLEVARALATEPELLLLDEPAAGLNIRETEEMATLIHRIRDLGHTVVLVEHDMSLVMDISDEVLVLNYGKLIAEGTPSEVQQDPAVIEAYLGSEDFDA